MSMFNYNDRANAQRLGGMAQDKIKLSKPEVPMWRKGNQPNGNFVYAPETTNPITNAIGVTPIKTSYQEPFGSDKTMYTSEITSGTGGWVNEFISATNSQRASQIAMVSSRFAPTDYL